MESGGGGILLYFRGGRGGYRHGTRAGSLSVNKYMGCIHTLCFGGGINIMGGKGCMKIGIGRDVL